MSATSMALAQEGPFNNASLHGTYSSYFINTGANEPSPNNINRSLIYFDGQGNHRGMLTLTNRAGEPDADGKPTRDRVRSLSDPATWRHFSGTYQVLHFGDFLWGASVGGTDREGLVARAEMINGVTTITEWIIVGIRTNSRTGGMQGPWYGTRIADGDILPPAPAAE